MSGPVHFDVTAIEAGHRAGLAAMTADARAHASTDADQRFIDLQVRFHELPILAAKLCAQAENDGYGRRMIAQALGIAVGTAQAQLIGSCASDPVAVNNLLHFVETTVEILLVGEATEGISLAETMVVAPVPGGHA